MKLIESRAFFYIIYGSFCKETCY